MRRLALAVAIVLVIAACGGSADVTTDPGATAAPTTESPPATATTTTGATGTTFDASVLQGDLPGACTIIPADEMSDLLGNEVTAEETFGIDCIYEPADGVLSGAAAGVTLLSVVAEECAVLLQTEPIFPDETVEPAPEYGDLASLVVGSVETKYDLCIRGLSIIVSVMGPEAVSAAQRSDLAKTIVDLVLDRL